MTDSSSNNSPLASHNSIGARLDGVAWPSTTKGPAPAAHTGPTGMQLLETFAQLRWIDLLDPTFNALEGGAAEVSNQPFPETFDENPMELAEAAMETDWSDPFAAAATPSEPLPPMDRAKGEAPEKHAPFQHSPLEPPQIIENPPSPAVEGLKPHSLADQADTHTFGEISPEPDIGQSPNQSDQRKEVAGDGWVMSSPPPMPFELSKGSPSNPARNGETPDGEESVVSGSDEAVPINELADVSIFNVQNPRPPVTAPPLTSARTPEDSPASSSFMDNGPPPISTSDAQHVAESRLTEEAVVFPPSHPTMREAQPSHLPSTSIIEEASVDLDLGKDLLGLTTPADAAAGNTLPIQPITTPAYGDEHPPGLEDTLTSGPPAPLAVTPTAPPVQRMSDSLERPSENSLYTEYQVQRGIDVELNPASLKAPPKLAPSPVNNRDESIEEIDAPGAHQGARSQAEGVAGPQASHHARHNDPFEHKDSNSEQRPMHGDATTYFDRKPDLKAGFGAAGHSSETIGAAMTSPSASPLDRAQLSVPRNPTHLHGSLAEPPQSTPKLNAGTPGPEITGKENGDHSPLRAQAAAAPREEKPLKAPDHPEISAAPKTLTPNPRTGTGANSVSAPKISSSPSVRDDGSIPRSRTALAVATPTPLSMPSAKRPAPSNPEPARVVVSIGRITVAEPSAKPQPQRNVRATPRIKLDQYLAKRRP